MAEQPRRGVLLALAAEGVIPVVGGCAGALAGGPEAGLLGGMVGVAVGQAVEKVINFFGARIVHRWGDWFRSQPEEVRQQALAELASTPPEEARQQASDLLDKLALEPISPADKEIALSYLTLLPGSLDRALPREIGTGLRSLPPTMSFDEPSQMLGLLPMTLPPYSVGSDVPNTPYRLDALLGSGGFGAVYRASTRSLQHLPLAIKFCLDPALALSLQRERSNLERLMKAGGQDWSPRVVRLYGYDLEHATPYLVYEFVTGGDLTRHVAEQREKLGRPLNPSEVLDLITQTAEALAFAHRHGLVHRDLKPANVLVESGVLKLADFGLGGVTAARAALVSRIGATTVDTLSAADQASLFRGSGTPLYMSPEQRRGQPPDPRHDLYSLGVMWYQLLAGDVSRELHPGWAKELTLRYGVPKGHISLIESCVGYYDERPKSAVELLALIREAGDEPTAPPPPTNPATSAPPVDGMRRGLLVSLVQQLQSQHAKIATSENLWAKYGPAGGAAVAVLAAGAESRIPPLVVLIFAAGAAAGCYVLTNFARKSLADEGAKGRELAILKLNHEFPDTVRDWGGEGMLRDAAVVADLAKQLVEPTAPVATPAAPALDDDSRKELRAMVAHVGERAAHAASFGARKPFPLLIAALLGLVLAVPAGIGAGMGLAEYTRPFGRLERGGFQHYSRSGQAIREGEYIAQSKQATFAAVVVGLAVGLGVALLVAGALSRVAWYRWQMPAGVVLGAILGVPAGIGSGFLYEYLAAPYWLRGEKGATDHFRSTGQAVSSVEYDVLKRGVVLEAVVVGLAVGWSMGLGVLLLYQLQHHRRAKRARADADAAAAGLAAEFPQFVATAGGVAALRESGRVSDLLRKLG